MLDLSTTSTVSGATTDADMIKYATENPTKFIFDKDGKYGYTWTIKKNDHLWGNGSGYLFPRKGQIYKSIYDPCPDGYRVAPKDLWNMFTVDGGNKSYTSSVPTTMLSVRLISTSPIRLRCPLSTVTSSITRLGTAALRTSIPLRAIATARPVR